MRPSLPCSGPISPVFSHARAACRAGSAPGPVSIAALASGGGFSFGLSSSAETAALSSSKSIVARVSFLMCPPRPRSSRSQLLRPRQIHHVQPDRVAEDLRIRLRRIEADGEHGLPAGTCDQLALMVACRLRPFDLPCLVTHRLRAAYAHLHVSVRARSKGDLCW